MGQAKKIPWYSHRLTHWKRVTSELHDSYFRLMTINHAISKIEWTLNYYITQLSFRLQLSWVRRLVTVELERDTRDVVGKATPGRRGPREPWLNWDPEKMLIRCSKESQQPSRVDPRASGWASGDRERHNVDGHKCRGQNISVYVQSPSPSHTQTLSNPFRTLAIKWEVHIFC